MTVASSTSKSGPYAGNGATTVFAFAFKVQQAADIKVVRTITTNGTAVDTVLTSGADYTVSVNADQSASPGGNVTMTAAPAVGQQITILRNVTATQGTSIPNQGGFYPRVVESALDKLTMLVQQLSEESGRALKLSVADSITNLQDLLLALNTAVTTASAAESAATSGAEVATEGAATATAQANIAVTQAAAAMAAAASIGFRDVLFLTAANSPYTVTQTTSGCLLNVDTSFGNVVVNLPAIADLPLPFTVGVKKATSDANTVTVNRGGTDLFDDGTTATSLAAVSGVTLVPDTETTPDKWTVVGWGGTSLAQSNTWTGMQTFRDNKLEITDDSDTTKKVVFQLSSVSSGQTRILSVPDKSGTLATMADVSTGIPRSARTANAALGVADKGKFIDVTSNTFTQTFDAAATLGDGWFVWYRNSGTGDITLDPNGAETIDSRTSFVMYPGEARLIQCDGAGLNSVVINPFVKTFTVSDNFIKPPGYSMFEGLLWAGGASGAKNLSSRAGGGGGGACFPFKILAAALAATTAVTIGAGGAAQASSNTGGNPGGNSSFAGLISYGGKGGINGAGAVGGNGGGAGIDTTSVSADGLAGSEYASGTTNAAYGGAAGSGTATGGKSVYGGAGGGGCDANVGPGSATGGGTSVFGGNGGAGGNIGTDGAAPSGGGGGSISGNSGAGARGEMRIWGVI